MSLFCYLLATPQVIKQSPGVPLTPSTQWGGMQLSARHLLPDGFMSPERELDLEKAGPAPVDFMQGGTERDKDGVCSDCFVPFYKNQLVNKTVRAF